METEKKILLTLSELELQSYSGKTKINQVDTDSLISQNKDYQKIADNNGAISNDLESRRKKTLQSQIEKFKELYQSSRKWR